MADWLCLNVSPAKFLDAAHKIKLMLCHRKCRISIAIPPISYVCLGPELKKVCYCNFKKKVVKMLLFDECDLNQFLFQSASTCLGVKGSQTHLFLAWMQVPYARLKFSESNGKRHCSHLRSLYRVQFLSHVPAHIWYKVLGDMGNHQSAWLPSQNMTKVNPSYW